MPTLRVVTPGKPFVTEPPGPTLTVSWRGSFLTAVTSSLRMQAIKCGYNIRSNAVTICVYDATAGGCGIPGIG